MHLAVKAKSPEMVAMLLEKGADIHALNKDGHQPLFLTRATGVNADKNLSAIGDLLREAPQKQMASESGK